MTLTKNPMRIGVGLALVGAFVAADARADGVGQIMTSKSLPPATVAVIDPEGGSSGGCDPSCSCGGPGCCCTDVRIAPGDIILFRFNYIPVPNAALNGIQGFLTEYVPGNTEVVGMRLIDDNDLTISPRFPGISYDGCGKPCNRFDAVPCASGTCNLDDGSISQVQADTGIFFAADTRLQRNPGASFLTLKNGVLMDPPPRDANSIAATLNTSLPVYAHNAWDWIQIRAFGTQNNGAVPADFSGNRGNGNTPFGYGSPVAGPDTHYSFEATEVALNDIEFNGVVGPWQRVVYPGSQIGAGPNSNGLSPGPLQRANTATSTGFDLTPNNPLPTTTRAVRVAMGEVRSGVPGRAEVALRVLATPLDPVQNRDVDCGEVFGADSTATSSGKDSPWRWHLPYPACVFLNLLFDHNVIIPANKLASVGDQLKFEIRGKNLSINPQTNVVVKQKYNSQRMAFVSATGGATLVSNCDGDGKDCLIWPTMTLQPSDEYVFESSFTSGGVGHLTTVSDAVYTSDQLPAPGFRTQAVVLSKAVPVVNATLRATTPSAAPGGTADLAGTLSNDGNTDSTYNTLTIILPTGWTVTGAGTEQITLGGQTFTCSADCGTDQPEFNLSESFVPSDLRALSFSVNVPIGESTGLHPISLQVWGQVAGFGGSYESYFAEAAFVPVGAVRSDPPVVRCPIGSSDTSVSGTTTEADGTIIRLYLNGIERGQTTAAGGTWTVSGLDATFGELYGGLEVRATAESVAPLELESEKSLLDDSCFSSSVPICQDGLDNDNDGLVDFPADPGCDSPTDPDEENPIYECSDGIDNEPDGFIDWPDDLSCSGPDDPTESGNPACSDGVDNDGDSLVDFAGGDPGCESANDPNEIDFAACEDGKDNDGDGFTDFGTDPLVNDPGCHSANDVDETDPPAPDPEAALRARLLIAFDTSGSMNKNTCGGEFTGGDGSDDCAGSDVPCATCNDGPDRCGDGLPNDSRMFKVKGGIADAVTAFGEVDFGLMRFHQRPITWACPIANASLTSGGWQGGGAAPCSGGFNAGDLLVGFSDQNTDDLLAYMDGSTNYPGTPPPGKDLELRGTGTTPLEGILTSARDYIEAVKADDSASDCRPYRVILVTDGQESCSGDPVARAAELCAAGIPVDVIGFATTDPTTEANLDAIANAGCGPSCDPDHGGPGQVCSDVAVLADDEGSLSAAIGRVVSSSILFELCNGLDDDCDGLTDEDYPGVWPAPGLPCDNGELGACFATGNIVCLSESTFGCDAPPGTPTAEECDNPIDEDCNGIAERCIPCVPATEVCNGADDDCDGETDESPMPGEGSACGVDIGECATGTLSCLAGALDCVGDVGPATEVCNNLDDDCDGVTDDFARSCYDPQDDGCPVGMPCLGECRRGFQTCNGGVFVPADCDGDVHPEAEACNGLDDDCDGLTDETFLDLGLPCDNGELGICFSSGTIVCKPDGSGTECSYPVVPPALEVCNDVDDDCDGELNEDLGPPVGDACGGACGTVQCICDPTTPPTNCTLRCQGGQSGVEECNNIDDDCDGFVDEEPLPGVGETCTDPGFEGIGDTGECEFGRSQCVDGFIQCVGYVGPHEEICNDLDEDCDGSLDAECPNEGEVCWDGGCITPCDSALEFPCPFGFVCLSHPDTGEDLCFPDPCEGVTCPPGSSSKATDPDTCDCVDPCEAIECPEGLTCVEGACLDCFSPEVGCPEGQTCVPGENGIAVCTSDPCEGVDCAEGTYCVNGRCAAEKCTPVCPAGETCVAGECCVVDQNVCFLPNGDPKVNCPRGQACNPDDGECIPDPCAFADCPARYECKVGCQGGAYCTRIDPPRASEYILITGEGGCGCRIGEGASGTGAAALLGGLFLLLVGARRRRFNK